MKPSTKVPNSTVFCIVSQSDIKVFLLKKLILLFTLIQGNVPKIIVNMASGKAPAEWINKFIKACERSRLEKGRRK